MEVDNIAFMGTTTQSREKSDELYESKVSWFWEDGLICFVHYTPGWIALISKFSVPVGVTAFELISYMMQNELCDTRDFRKEKWYLSFFFNGNVTWLPICSSQLKIPDGIEELKIKLEKVRQEKTLSTGSDSKLLDYIGVDTDNFALLLEIEYLRYVDSQEGLKPGVRDVKLIKLENFIPTGDTFTRGGVEFYFEQENFLTLTCKSVQQNVFRVSLVRDKFISTQRVIDLANGVDQLLQNQQNLLEKYKGETKKAGNGLIDLPGDTYEWGHVVHFSRGAGSKIYIPKEIIATTYGRSSHILHNTEWYMGESKDTMRGPQSLFMNRKHQFKFRVPKSGNGDDYLLTTIQFKLLKPEFNFSYTNGGSQYYVYKITGLSVDNLYQYGR